MILYYIFQKYSYTFSNVYNVYKEIVTYFLLIDKESLNYANNMDSNYALISAKSNYNQTILQIVNIYRLLKYLTYFLLNTEFFSYVKVYLNWHLTI